MVLSLQVRVRIQKILIATALTLTTLFGVAAPLTTQAAQSVPYKVNFQGRLTDNNGNILPDGSYNVQFRLYDALSSGTLKWTENRVFGASDNRIVIQNGLFNIQFGDLTALSPSLFSGAFPLYLEVELPTPASATCASNGCAVFTEGPMTPRQPMASSAYAINSDTIDGIDSTGLVQLTPSGQQTGSINISGNVTTAAAVQGSSAAFTGAAGLSLGSTTSAATLVFNDGTSNARAVTLNSPALTASYSLSLPTTAPNTNECLVSDSTTASQLKFASCSGVATTLQSAYTASNNPEITIGALPTSGLTVRDNAIAIVGNLLEVQNNLGTTTYFGVTNAGISVAGTATASVAFSGPVLDAPIATSLTVGATNATSVTIGKASVGVSAPGGLTTSNGAINTGSGSITTTGTLSAGAITTSGTLSAGATTVTSLNAGSGTIQTTGSLTGGAITGTSLTVGTGSITAGTVTASTIIQPSANNTVDLGTATAAFRNLYLGNLDTGTTTTAMNIGATNAASITIGKSSITTTFPGILQVGSSTADATQVNLKLDQSNVFADSGACTATSNGSLYYNAASNAIRTCIGNSWEDVVTTAGLGILAFGVVQDTGANPGDIQSISTASTASGPCQPYWIDATHVGWTACTAYSGGRKVTIAASTVAGAGNVTSAVGLGGTFQHLCLNGTDSQPTLSARGTEVVNLPAFSANNPVLCLADLKFATLNNGTITEIYDTRVFSNSIKTYAYTAAAMAPGRLATLSTNKITNTPAGNAVLVGIVGVTDGTTVGTNGAPNAILVTSGPATVKVISGAAGNYLVSGATAGYGTPTATAAAGGNGSPAGYLYGGVVLTSFSATCSNQINCFGSVVVNLSIR